MLKTAFISLLACAANSLFSQTNPTVEVQTSYGNFTIELFADKAPKTVDNFLKYVAENKYNKTIFHRVINGFMIQGGGFDVNMNQQPTYKSIENEANNGLKNTTGTIAMARTNDPHSATNQFFINVQDNHSLNHTGENNWGWGYCVFGRVTKGYDVIDKIRKVKTTSKGMHQDVPVEPVVIESIKQTAIKS